MGASSRCRRPRSANRSHARCSTSCSTSPAPGSRRSCSPRTTQQQSNVPDLSTTEALLRLLLAAALGGAVGLERELRDHEAGLRTHLLVSLGACVFTLVSAYAWSDWTFSQKSGVTLDPTRIAAQIVTGIGFLGAG